ncbi:MAG TPA: choice-of-anchor Q domain-containing protein, partial [Gammaproteobacteria bacterium]|nr:choice-of-anchor Q domain-containing protein [Gammaproteobacteria bacterium]
GGTLTLTRTAISGNSAADGAEVNNAGDSSVTAASFNLFSYRGLTNGQAFENFTPGPTDITATSNGNDPTTLANILNTTLANNGGPTRTHALVAGSPAIDMVTDGTCPPPLRDQRGVRRPQDGNHDGAAICDTGSFERR